MRAARRCHRNPSAGVGIATSMMARPVIERLARDLRRIGDIEVRVVPVENRFFGPVVTVAGLLCGQDVLEQVREQCGDFTRDDLLLLPRVMLDNAGKRFLDDVTVEDFRAQAPAPVTFARTADEIVAAVQSLAGVAGVAARDGVIPVGGL